MLRLSWLISLGISLFGVMVIEYFFTMKADEQSTVGGNLGALGIALILPFLLLSLLTTFRYFSELVRGARDTLLRTFFLMLGVGLAAFFAAQAIDFKEQVYTELGGTTKDAASIIYGFPLVNEYTNKIFINFYTFGFVHTICAIVGALYGLIKPAKPMLEEDKPL